MTDVGDVSINRMLKRMIRPCDRHDMMHRSGEAPWVYHTHDGAAVVERIPRRYKLQRALTGVSDVNQAGAMLRSKVGQWDALRISKGTIVHATGPDVFIRDVHWIHTERFGYIPAARRDPDVGTVLLAKLQPWDPAPWDPDTETLVKCYGAMTRADALAEHAYWQSSLRRRALRATWGPTWGSISMRDDDDAQSIVAASYEKGGLRAVSEMLRAMKATTIAPSHSVIVDTMRREAYRACEAMYEQLRDDERDWAMLVERRHEIERIRSGSQLTKLPQWFIREHSSAARTLAHNSALARAHADCSSVAERSRTLARGIYDDVIRALDEEINALRTFQPENPALQIPALHANTEV